MSRHLEVMKGMQQHGELQHPPPRQHPPRKIDAAHMNVEFPGSWFKTVTTFIWQQGHFAAIGY